MINTVELHIYNNYTHVVSHNHSTVNALKERMSVMVKGARFSEKYRRKLWDGKINFLKDGKFLTGLLPLVAFHLNELGAQCYFIDNRRDPGTTVHSIQLKAGISLRDYQQIAVASAIQNKRGLIAAATNSGKTILAAGLMQALGIRTLFLTHRDELFRQTKDSLEKSLGEELGVINAEEVDLTKRFTIAMVPTLNARLGTKKSAADLSILNYIRSVDMVIVDEAHHAAADTYERVIIQSDAYYRIGLTGTPTLEDVTKELKLIGLLGYSIFEISNKELIERGVSSVPNIKLLSVDYPIYVDKAPSEDKRQKKSAYDKIYKLGIIENPKRNNLIVKECKDFRKRNLQTLIIINKIAHGKFLKDYLLSNGFSPEEVKFVSGKSKKDNRRQAFDDFAAGKLPILIASLIVQEGISMDAIGAMIFALGEKSDIRVIQCLGRALRQNKHGNKVEVRDFMDYSHDDLLKHSKRRLDAYNQTLREYTSVVDVNILEE